MEPNPLRRCSGILRKFFNHNIFRNPVRALGLLLLFLIGIFFLLGGCSERERKNPFDPGSRFKVPIQLSLTVEEGQVTLSWSVQEVKDYVGFRLYRGVDDSSHMELWQELPASRKTFTDTSISYYHWYYYQVSVLGHGVESAPSAMQKTYPGPGTPYILSRYGYSLYQLSYDLLHTTVRYNIQLAPKSWAWDFNRRTIWLATAQFGTVSRLRLDVGQEDLFLDEPFRRPEDLSYDEEQNRLVVLDSRKSMVYLLENALTTDSILLPDADWSKVQIGWQHTIWVLGKHRALVFNALGDSLFHFIFETDQEGMDLFFQNNQMYVLTSNVDMETSYLYRFAENQSTPQFLELSGVFFIVRQAAADSNYWMGEYMVGGNYRAVKLSPQGRRLLEISSLRSLADIAINPVDGSIVLAQRYEDAVSLYTSNGQHIATRTEIYDPVKVLIQE